MNCPSCDKKMEQRPKEMIYDCPDCGKTITEYEFQLFNSIMNAARRIVKKMGFKYEPNQRR